MVFLMYPFHTQQPQVEFSPFCYCCTERLQLKVALSFHWKVPFVLCHDFGTCLVKYGFFLVVSFSWNSKTPSDPVSSSTLTSFFIRIFLLLWHDLTFIVITSMIMAVIPCIFSEQGMSFCCSLKLLLIFELSRFLLDQRECVLLFQT